MATAVTKFPAAVAPASAVARATKVDRLKYLETWSVENPLATIEAARDAVKQKYGMSLGTKIISDTLRNARALWEAQRKQALDAGTRLVSPPRQAAPQAPAPAPSTEMPALNQQVGRWVQEMRVLGVRLVELLPDGSIRVELANFTPSPPAS